MPTYVYACDTCQVQFEKFQSFHDEPLRTCPACQNAVRRVLQPAGIVFKGGGWHINDYRSTPKESGESSTTAPSTPAPAASNDAPAPPAAPAASPTPAPSSSTDS